MEDFDAATRRRRIEEIETEVNEVISNFRAIHGDKIASVVAGLVRGMAQMEQNMQLVSYFAQGKIPEEEILALLQAMETNGKEVMTLLVQPIIAEWPENLRIEVNRVVEVALTILLKLRQT